MAHRIPCAFIRGGTSKALVFHLKDLPANRSEWDAIFLRAMGSPDPYGRQLDGMGGGVSSLSKVCVIGPPSVPGADVDYTFAQVQVKEARVDYSGNCGNMSSAIGPFAVDEKLVDVARNGEVQVRIHNTNTRKIIHSTFEVRDGRSVETGALEIPGVHGTAAPIRLDFLEPGGASTGKLLPTGNAADDLLVTGIGKVPASMVDAANACVFIDARTLGLRGTELPDEIEANANVLDQLREVRLYASVKMGITRSLDDARNKPMIPMIAFVSAPQDSPIIGGGTVRKEDCDLVVRMISNGQPHRALPLTGSLCTAVAAQIEGSIPHQLANARRGQPLRLAMPSGVLSVDASVVRREAGWHAEHGSFYRTTRRLFEGWVYA
ncbi:2-methylaconitate cis-trans isomerase PrpF family protein [Ramlibacter albus]|uniref:PrpF family protein n=1 Tax=Ramlibacter albus TaxID=2079448 RepID=A0A923M7T3_9BURK|nr:PrpF domain-containing protein [Ramlibacter albus]MBC5765837.1 PrpF family protein [Ramlibacter albus]